MTAFILIGIALACIVSAAVGYLIGNMKGFADGVSTREARASAAASAARVGRAP